MHSPRSPLAAGRGRLAGVALAVAVVVILAGTLIVIANGGPAATASPTPGSSATAGGSPSGAIAIASPTGTATATLAPTPSPTRRSTTAPTGTPHPVASPTPNVSAAGGVPAFSHIYVIVMENREYGSIVGDSSAPYINSLIHQYGLAANLNAVTHPSEPNYIALFSGSTQGVTDDGVHDISATNLADQLDAHGRSWRVFAQNVPSGCYTGYSASGGPDGSGTYTRKHEPAISFTDISGSPSRCARILDFSQFNPAAADFELIVPNMCNDMHDCSTATGDAFLRSFVPRITSSPAFANSLLVITWDEGTSDIGGGGHIATVVVSPLVKAGTVSPVAHSLYSILRTVEDAWGLGCLNHACSANDLREFFR